MDGIKNLFRKKLEDGDLSPEIISQIESMAATGADASTISALVGVSEEQVNNVLMSGSTSEVMPVEGEEMVETAEVTEEADPLLNLFQQNDSLNNDQAITTLFAQQEPQGIMAAKGGRIRFAGGGKDAGKDSDFGNENYGGAGGGDRPNIGQISGPVTSSFTDADDNRDNYKTDQYTTGPKTRTKTIDSPKLNKITGKKIPTYTIQTPFSPKTKTGFGPKGKDTWYEAATKNINKNIKDVNRSKSPFSLLDVVLTIGSLGILNPATTKAFKTISNIRTGLKVSSIVDTKTKSVKDIAKDIITSTGKKAIKDEYGIDVDVTLDTIQKALDTKIGKSVVDKFNSLNTTNKNTTKNNTTKTTTFNGGDNDGPLPNITPVVPELIAEEVIVEEPETSLFSMSNLNRIRDRQNRRKSFFANRGGLAGLFRVKNQ
jgi:DNA replication protein DnaD